MSAKIHDFGSGYWGFHCPGCNYDHSFQIPSPLVGTSRPLWAWNGSIDKPTFTPSLLVNKDDGNTRCHSFVTDGRIQFLSDCFHSLAGQTWEDS